MAPISLFEIGMLVNAIKVEQMPLVKADLLRTYVIALDAHNGSLKDARRHYETASKHYELVISVINGDDSDLREVLQKRADYCRLKAGLPPSRKD